MLPKMKKRKISFKKRNRR